MLTGIYLWTDLSNYILKWSIGVQTHICQVGYFFLDTWVICGAVHSGLSAISICFPACFWRVLVLFPKAKQTEKQYEVYRIVRTLFLRSLSLEFCCWGNPKCFPCVNTDDPDQLVIRALVWSSDNDGRLTGWTRSLLIACGKLFFIHNVSHLTNVAMKTRCRVIPTGAVRACDFIQYSSSQSVIVRDSVVYVQISVFQ